MKFLEKNLEDIVYEQLKSDQGCKTLKSRGLNLDKPTRLFRQLQIGSYGVADIVSLDRVKEEFVNHKYDPSLPISVNILELKKDIINIDTFFQALRYWRGIRRFVDKYYNNYELDIYYNIVLIGSKSEINDDLPTLLDFIEYSSFCCSPIYTNVTIYEYEYRFDGIYFNRVDLSSYDVKNPGFFKQQITI